jgi:hypothetical protein
VSVSVRIRFDTHEAARVWFKEVREAAFLPPTAGLRHMKLPDLQLEQPVVDAPLMVSEPVDGIAAWEVEPG